MTNQHRQKLRSLQSGPAHAVLRGSCRSYEVRSRLRMKVQAHLAANYFGNDEWLYLIHFWPNKVINSSLPPNEMPYAHFLRYVSHQHSFNPFEFRVCMYVSFKGINYRKDCKGFGKCPFQMFALLRVAWEGIGNWEFQVLHTRQSGREGQRWPQRRRQETYI